MNPGSWYTEHDNNRKEGGIPWKTQKETVSLFDAVRLRFHQPERGFVFLLYRLQGIGVWLKNISGILAPFIYGGVVAYLLRPLCNTYERFLEKHLPDKMKKMASSMAVFGSLLTGLLMVYALAAMIVPQVVESLITLGKTIPGRIETFISWAEETFGENEYMDGVFTFSTPATTSSLPQ